MPTSTRICGTINLVGKLLPDISQEEQELIQGGNSERLFRF